MMSEARRTVKVGNKWMSLVEALQLLQAGVVTTAELRKTLGLPTKAGS